MKWITLLAALALGVGCTSRSTPVTSDPTTPDATTGAPVAPDVPEAPPAAPTGEVPVLGSDISVDEALGHEVMFTGEAANAKLGAMVHTDAQMLYCIELDEWPDEILGKQVTVTGTLERTDQFKAQVAKDGAISQGSAGGDLLLHGMTYEVQ